MKNLLVLSSLLFIITCVGCKKKHDTTNPPTPAAVMQDSAFIANTLSEEVNCLRGIRDGDVAQALFQFFSLSNGTAANQAWIDQMNSSLKTEMGTIVLNSLGDKFDYSSLWGSYTWNISLQKFDKFASNKITVTFPSAPNLTSNNSVVEMSDFTDGTYLANAKTVYLPKSIKATATKNGVLMASVDFTASYSTSSTANFPTPLSVVANVYFNPHSYKFTISQISTTQFKVTTDLLSGTGCTTSFSATVAFKNDDYNNFVLEDDLQSIQGKVQKGNFIVSGFWDASTYYALGSTTTANINSTFTCEIDNGGDKIGELRFKDVSGVRRTYIFFRDGSSKPIEDFSDTFLNDTRNILRPYFGNQVDTWFKAKDNGAIAQH